MFSNNKKMFNKKGCKSIFTASTLKKLKVIEQLIFLL